MNNAKRVILIAIFSMVSFIIFVMLDNGVNVKRIDQLIQPLIFTFTFIIGIFFHSASRYLLGVSIFLLSLMIFTYLFASLDISNWIGSLGFGILLVVSCTYLPQFIKKGYIDKY